MAKIIVDFIMPEAASGGFVAAPAPKIAQARPAAGGTHLGKCICGGSNYVLASELQADAIKGIGASRMFECTGCGEYRLG